MALSTVETALQGILGRLAKEYALLQTNITGGTDLWTRVDAAGDETFENRVKGATATEADLRTENAEFGTPYWDFLDLLQQYAVSDLAYSGLDAYLTAKRWRVPQEFAEWWYRKFWSPLSTANIYPKYDTNYLGTMLHGSTFTDGAEFTTTARGQGVAATLEGRIVATVPDGVTIGSGSWGLTATCEYAGGTTFAASIPVANGSPAGTEFEIGSQLLSGNEDAGQTLIALAATTQFQASEKVLIWDNNAAEVAEVLSVDPGVSITVTTGIRHSYTTAATAKVAPLFKDITACVTGSGGAGGDTVVFGCNCDRDAAL